MKSGRSLRLLDMVSRKIRCNYIDISNDIDVDTENRKFELDE